MPIDYSKYPKNWKTEIRPDILERANNCCEHEGCSAKNYDIGYRDIEGKFFSWKEIEDALEIHGYDYFDYELKNCWDKKGNPTKPIKIVLTIAHLDNDVNNNDYSNLKALCQYHHLKMDLPHHMKNARATIERKKGLQRMF